MSLINQMLQDLDARRAAPASGAALPSAVRPLPPAPPPVRWPVYVMLAFVLGGVLGGVWYFLNVNAGVDAPPSTVPFAAMEPPPPVLPPVAQTEAAEVAASPPAAVEPQAEPIVLGESLRLSEQLARQGEVKTAPKTVKGATGSVSAAARPRVEERAHGASPEAVTPGAERSAGVGRSPALRAGSIERHDAPVSPRDRAESLYRKAIGEVNQGRVAEGNEALREALKQDPMHVAARQLLVRLLFEARQSDAAMAVLESGLEVLPAQLGWAMSLARLQVERGDYPAAWKTLQHSEPAAGGNADFQGFAGHVLLRLGKSREAGEHFRHALRSSPADGRWWLGLGLAFEAEGRIDEAREAWQTARRSSNLSPDLLRLVEQKLK